MWAAGYRGDAEVISKTVDIGLDFIGAYLFKRAFPMEEDKTGDPINISLFGAEVLMYLVQQFWRVDLACPYFLNTRIFNLC